MADKLVVTYEDTSLYESDVGLLEPGVWVNDRLLAFYFDYLTNTVVKPGGGGGTWLLVNPSTAGLFAFLPDPEELAVLLEPLGLGGRGGVVVPVNNSPDPSRPGGSHWSLLVFWRESGLMYHLDSHHNVRSHLNMLFQTHPRTQMNLPAAKRVAAQLSGVLGLEEGGKVESLRTVPQQINSSDCGLYVLLFTQLLLKEALANLSQPKWLTSQRLESLLSPATPEAVAALRPQLRDLIRSLATQLPN